MTTAEIIASVRARTNAERRAKLIALGTQLAFDNPRKNDNWDIVWALPVTTVPQKGCLPCEIVIGNRHTDFQPYVAWHCFGGNSYTWGHYCQTFDGAFDEAMGKWSKEMGLKGDAE